MGIDENATLIEKNADSLGNEFNHPAISIVTLTLRNSTLTIGGCAGIFQFLNPLAQVFDFFQKLCPILS